MRFKFLVLVKLPLAVFLLTLSRTQCMVRNQGQLKNWHTFIRNQGHQT